MIVHVPKALAMTVAITFWRQFYQAQTRVFTKLYHIKLSM